MTTTALPDVQPRRRYLLRWLRNALIAAVVLVILLLVAGGAYQWIAQSADARRFPQQGRSVVLGPSFPGLSLNLNCTGQGSPTVILDSGAGVPAVGWSLAQPEIAKFSRVCSYDRAGYGWSGAGPMPRTSAEIVKELHALLEAGRESGPYVLVGHSFGGFNVRVYNHEYPNDVVGVVLVDGAHEDQFSRMSPALQAFTKKQAEALNKGTIAAPFLIRFGILRLISKLRPPTEPFGGTKELLAEILYLQLQPKFRGALASESEFAFSESADEVRAAGNLGDRPLIVLTAGRIQQPIFLPRGVSQKDLDDFHAAWVNDLQPREVHLSTRGKQIMVNDSDHMIPFERPDAIVNAVSEVCAAVNLSIPTPP